MRRLEQVVLTQKQIDVIWALSYGRMNASRAAKILKKSHSTVSEQMGEIANATGLDPKDFWDLTELIEMVKKQEDEQC